MRSLMMAVATALVPLACVDSGPDKSLDIGNGGAAAPESAEGCQAPGIGIAGASGLSGAAAYLDEDRRYCANLLDYQASGGFWCNYTATGDVVETRSTDGCATCYMVVCYEVGYRWLQVECSGL